MFNRLEITQLEKISRDCGWDLIFDFSDGTLPVGSARHEESVLIMDGEEDDLYRVRSDKRFFPDLNHKFSILVEDDHLLVQGKEKLALILHRISELSVSLPNTPLEAFKKTVEQEIQEKDIRDSERVAEVKQRVGQNLYRKAQEEYWQGSCAVTGISLREVLRASHAKPWVDCEAFEERLSVFNGFLLSANLDALFDKGLISFSDTGEMLVANEVHPWEREKLGIDKGLSLRWISEEHLSYLAWHREKVFKRSKK